MHHVQSPIVLYTKLDAECDQQVFRRVGRLLTPLGQVHHRRQVSSTTEPTTVWLFVVLSDGGRAVAKCLEFWAEFQGKTLF